MRRNTELEYLVYLDKGNLILERLKYDPYVAKLTMCSKEKGILSFQVAGQEIALQFSYNLNDDVVAMVVNGTKRNKIK